MPPRRKARADVKTSVQSTPSVPEQRENVSPETQKSLARWTDEQEIALLKGIVRWKPVGMHKHFRIIAIHNYMIGQGVVSSDDEHTTIPGLWTKLRSLYNLPILDEREDSIMHSSSDENGSAGGRYCPYELPDNEYAAMKFDKRINLNGSKSPALLPSRGESTIADTDEPRSSPVPGARGGRATRRGGRISKLQQEAGGSRRASKAASVADDQPMEDSGEQEGDDEEGSDGDVAAESPKPKGTARSTAKGRGTLKNKGVRVRSSTRSRARRK